MGHPKVGRLCSEFFQIVQYVTECFFHYISANGRMTSVVARQADVRRDEKPGRRPGSFPGRIRGLAQNAGHHRAVSLLLDELLDLGAAAGPWPASAWRRCPVVRPRDEDVHGRVAAFDGQRILVSSAYFQGVVGSDQRHVDLGQHARQGRGFQFADLMFFGLSTMSFGVAVMLLLS